MLAPDELKQAVLRDEHTGIPMARLDNLHRCAEAVIRNGVPGDLLEAGAWRGGTCILMRGILQDHNVTDRRVWVADSFQGLPTATHERDLGHGFEQHGHLRVPLAEVKRNFAQYGLLDEQVVFVEGWFQDTLPGLPVEKLALLRLDADLYESTMTALECLYDRVSPGGYVIIDDYGHWSCCREAVDEFRRRRSIHEPMGWTDYTEVYWEVAPRAHGGHVADSPPVAIGPADP